MDPSSGRSDFYLYCRQQGIWPEEISGHQPSERDWFSPFEPLRNVSATYPPTLLLHGEADTDVPFEQSVLMAEQLASQGVAHGLHRCERSQGAARCGSGAGVPRRSTLERTSTSNRGIDAGQRAVRGRAHGRDRAAAASAVARTGYDPSSKEGPMTLTIQDLGALGELLGSIAVLVTLVYLAFQTRQNRMAISAQLDAARINSVLTEKLNADRRGLQTRRG